MEARERAAQRRRGPREREREKWQDMIRLKPESQKKWDTIKIILRTITVLCGIVLIGMAFSLYFYTYSDYSHSPFRDLYIIGIAVPVRHPSYLPSCHDVMDSWVSRTKLTRDNPSLGCLRLYLGHSRIHNHRCQEEKVRSASQRNPPGGSRRRRPAPVALQSHLVLPAIRAASHHPAGVSGHGHERSTARYQDHRPAPPISLDVSPKPLDSDHETRSIMMNPVTGPSY